MRGGRIVSGSLPPLSEIWELARRNLERLPEEYRRLSDPERYPVRYSEGLLTLRDRALAAHDGGR
jgi:hypothetical protein